MKEISVYGSGTNTPVDNSILIVPSFNNGGATATQIGNKITVTCANVHNISPHISDGINHQNVRVYINFSSGIPSDTYYNIIIVNTNIFTCESKISRNIITAVSVIPLGTSAVAMTGLNIYFPPKNLKGGSSIRTEIFFHMPIISRGVIHFGLGIPSFPLLFVNNNSNYASLSSYFMYSMIYFMNDSDFITSYDVQHENAQTKVIGSLINISTTGLTLCPGIQFESAATNDYIMCSMIKSEYVR